MKLRKDIPWEPGMLFIDMIKRQIEIDECEIFDEYTPKIYRRKFAEVLEYNSQRFYLEQPQD